MAVYSLHTDQITISTALNMLNTPSIVSILHYHVPFYKVDCIILTMLTAVNIPTHTARRFWSKARADLSSDTYSI